VDEMRAGKLVAHMKANVERVSEEVTKKIRASQKCVELSRTLTVDEQNRATADIYRDLTTWLATESDSGIEQRYVVLGLLRAQQGVPFSNLFWAVCIAQEYLWQYMQQETLLEEPVEFWGGVILLSSMTQFFNRVVYFALQGYEQAADCEPRVSVAKFVRGQAS
jgi:hypothetical protein